MCQTKTDTAVEFFLWINMSSEGVWNIEFYIISRSKCRLSRLKLCVVYKIWLGAFVRIIKSAFYDVRNGCETMRRCLMDESSQVGRIISSEVGGMMSSWWWWPLYSLASKNDSIILCFLKGVLIKLPDTQASHTFWIEWDNQIMNQFKKLFPQW